MLLSHPHAAPPSDSVPTKFCGHKEPHTAPNLIISDTARSVQIRIARRSTSSRFCLLDYSSVASPFLTTIFQLRNSSHICQLDALSRMHRLSLFDRFSQLVSSHVASEIHGRCVEDDRTFYMQITASVSWCHRLMFHAAAPHADDSQCCRARELPPPCVPPSSFVPCSPM